jgi:hypothetical protein
LTLDRDGGVRSHDAVSGEVLAAVPNLANRAFVHAELDPDGDRALLTDQQNAVFFVAALDTRPSVSRLSDQPVTIPPVLSPSGRQFALVLAPATTNLTIWETSARRQHLVIAHREAIRAVAFGPTGDSLATIAGERHVRIWNVASGDAISPPLALASPAVSLRFSPDGRRLLVVTKNGVQVFDTRTGDLAEKQPPPDPSVSVANFSPDNRQIITAGTNSPARVWDAATGQLIASLIHAAPVRQIAPSPDGRFVGLMTTKAIQLWETKTWAPHRWILPVGPDAGESSFHPSADRLLVPGVDGAYRAFVLDRHLSDSLLEDVVRTPASAELWTHLLAGRQVSDGGALTTIPSSALRTMWDSLRPRIVPSSVDAKKIQKASHEKLARSAETNQLWFAASFHWERLARAEPRNPTLAEHVARVQQAMIRADTIEVHAPDLKRHLPPRATNTPPALIDLGAHYNALLDQPWLPAAPGAPTNDLAALLPGVQRFNGVSFDVRGLIQLSSRNLENQGGRFPRLIDDLAIGQKAQRLHFLHGAVWASLTGTPIGRYVVHYDDGGTQEIRLVFGRDLREWWVSPTQQPLTTGAALAWEGTNPASKGAGFRLRLFQMTWINPRPAVSIARIEFESFMESSAPFLLAITADPGKP